MKTIDLSLFSNENLVIKSLRKKEYKIKKNISVALSIGILNAIENLSKHTRDSEEYAEILENITHEIISKDQANFVEYIKADFDSIEAQENLFLIMYSELCELANNPILKMPDVKIKQENNKYIVDSDEMELMDGITYIMSKTSNNFTEIMNMPYACYLSILKHLRISEYIQNEEYREAYYKQKREDYYKKNKKDNRNKNGTKKQKVDIDGLKNFNI